MIADLFDFGFHVSSIVTFSLAFSEVLFLNVLGVWFQSFECPSAMFAGKFGSDFGVVLRQGMCAFVDVQRCGLNEA